jgi:hypothetical protein
MPTEGKNGGAPPPPDRAAREREAAAALDAIRAPLRASIADPRPDLSGAEVDARLAAALARRA